MDAWADIDQSKARRSDGLQWHIVQDELRQNLMSCVSPGRDCRLDGPMLSAWLDEIDDVQLQTLVIELRAQAIEADSEMQPGESEVLRATLELWVLPMEDHERAEPLVYGLDFRWFRAQASHCVSDVRSSFRQFSGRPRRKRCRPCCLSSCPEGTMPLNA